MSVSIAEVLEGARVDAGLTRRDLWVACYSLGGASSPEALDGFLDGSAVPLRGEYDVIAQALNDTYVGDDMNHPVPYSEDMGF